MADTEEGLRILLLLGNAAVPAARECVMLLARAVSWAARRGADLGRRGIGEVADRFDGHGTHGLVGSARKIGGVIQTTDVTGLLDRPDLSELGEICRRCGAAFSVEHVVIAGSTRLMLQFAASDASTIEAAIGAAVGARVVDDASLDSACSDPDPTARSVVFDGETWRREGGEFRLGFTSHTGAAMTACASEDGSWRVLAADGKPAMIGAELLEGRAPAELGGDLGAAMAMAGAHRGALTDPSVAERNEAFVKDPKYLAMLRSKDIMRAAANVVERNGGPGHGPRLSPAPRPRPARA